MIVLAFERTRMGHQGFLGGCLTMRHQAHSYSVTLLAESAAQSVRVAFPCLPFEWNSPLADADLLLYTEASSCALLQRFLNPQSWGPCCVSAPVAAVIAGIVRFLLGDVSPGESWLLRIS